jgi:hypothetical protein
MERCETCGTENREGAKFCRGCARALLPISPDDDAADTYSNRALRCVVCKAIYSRGASECAACGNPLGTMQSLATPVPEATAVATKTGRWRFVFAVLVTATVLGFWLLSPSRPAERRDDAAAAPLAKISAAGHSVPVNVEPVEAAAPVAAALDTEEKAHFEDLVKREAERAEKARQTVVRLAAQEKATQKARADRVTAERQRAEAGHQAVVSPEAVARAGVPQSPGEAVATDPAMSPKLSVEQACASASNFIARDLCRVEACRAVGNASDPICVWYRQLEEERRNRLAN